MKHLLTIGLILILVACGQKSNTEIYVEKKDSVTLTTQKLDSVLTHKVDIKTIHKSDFEKLLKDPKTSKMATELYHNKYQMKNDNEPLELFDFLKRKNIVERMFYFRAITNTYIISDGAYSEGLGYYGKEYIENNTCEFANYFDNKECFTDKDLETWVNIVLLEIEIDGESDNGYDKKIVINFNKKLKENCINASVNQKGTIDKFCTLLDKKYNEYIAQQ